MRYVVLDTETTGLEVRQGHRMIEVGCVELMDRQINTTEQGRFHHYINPERPVDAGAFAVHGISDDMLRDKPPFAQLAQAFLDFVRGSTLIIHNASFDVGFINAELERLQLGVLADHVAGVVDSLLMARERFPGKRNNLDALCDRLGVNNSHRQWHGALLDAQILAEVYLALTRGQDSLGIELESSATMQAELTSLGGLPLPCLQVSDQDNEAHQAYVLALEKESKKPSLWLQ
jgi:DNA polymerase-3 subunit epsilon